MLAGMGEEFPFAVVPAESFMHFKEEPLPPTGRPPMDVNPEEMIDGLNVDYYRKGEGKTWSKLADVGFVERIPFKKDVIPNVDNKAGSGFVLTSGQKDHIAASINGFVNVPADGMWTVGTVSDDGSKLWIDEELVADNDGLHGDRKRTGDVDLLAGWHKIRVEFFERGGGATIQVMAGMGEEHPFEVIPADAFMHFAEEPLPPTGTPPVDVDPEEMASGLHVDYYKKGEDEKVWGKLADIGFGDREPFKSDVIANIENNAGSGMVLTSGQKDHIAAVFKGFFNVPESGVWTVGTISDDGSKLYINDELVADNDGLHGDRKKTGDVDLQAGWHEVRVEFFERGGGATIKMLAGMGHSYPFEVVHPKAFKHIHEEKEPTGKPPAILNDSGLDDGIHVSYFFKGKDEKAWGKLAEVNFEDRKPDSTDVLKNIDNKAGSGMVLTS
jgi:hypothetical protein